MFSWEAVVALRNWFSEGQSRKFTKRQQLSTLSESLERSIDNVPIKQVSTTKSLGILIDDNMASHSHIDKLCKKIASGIGTIKRVRPLVAPEMLHYIYNALVQPRFTYCSIV